MSKLKLEKFSISKLTNPSTIFGGNVGDDGTIVKRPTRPKCVDRSRKLEMEKG
ncbi:hypothetical protein JL193_11300 [Polaribacter batillariae]|uniref:Uncharacterized protein n=1 Tax=Polaribacter batillariae TaxID=2808900 RepID=A0ABX7SR74_9FLAO|nr:hypothetical protein [Polaribacter batillariae]QTD36722.1 hypothetical protein JL193_11300 [Polaribacter batillariae]